MIKLVLIILIIFIIYYFFLNKKVVIKRIQLINFHSSWCHWSKKIKPLWEKLKEEMKFSNIDLIDIKCDSNKKLCDEYNIDSYPTIKLVNGNKVVEYTGDINEKDINLFIKDINLFIKDNI